MSNDKLLSKDLKTLDLSINSKDVATLVDSFLETIFKAIQEYCDMSNSCHNAVNYVKALDLLVEDENIKKEIKERYFN